VHVALAQDDQVLAVHLDLERVDFEYVAPEATPAPDDLGLQPTVEAGCGIVLSHTEAAIDAQVEEELAAEEANLEYADALPDQQQDVYLEVIGQMEAPGLAPTSEPTDCRQAATETILEPARQAQELLGESVAQVDAAIESRPDVQQAMEAWSQCMAGAGYDYADPAEPQQEILSAFTEGETPPDLEVLLISERTVAAADLNCRQQVGYTDTVILASVAEWQAAEIEDELVNTAVGAIQ
jgi:hypothetical protein